MCATKVRSKNAPPVDVSAELDRTDKAILRQLQRDASLSNVALAEKVHLSPPACLRRVERLKRLGLIEGVVALLNPKAVGAGMLVMIGVVLDRSTPESFAEFEKAAMLRDQKAAGTHAEIVGGGCCAACSATRRATSISRRRTRSSRSSTNSARRSS